MRTELAGVPVELIAPGAAWLPEPEALLVADLHLGKGAAFRAAGQPVPAGTSRETLGRLSAALAGAPSVRGVWILGDLFHGPAGVTPGLARSWWRWRDAHPDVPVSLVVGNHDRRLEEVAAGWGMAVSQGGLRVGGAELRHHPPARWAPGPDGDAAGDASSKRPRQAVVAGHLHPVVRIREGRRSRLRAACFWQRGDVLVLPALGALVDGGGIRPGPGDRVFVPAGDQVLEIPSAQLPSSARAG